MGRLGPLERGLRDLGHPRGRATLGRARDEAKVAGKGHHGEYRPERPREDLHALAITISHSWVARLVEPRISAVLVWVVAFG